MESEEIQSVQKRFIYAVDELYRLCLGGQWIIRDPAQESDSDLVLSSSLSDIPKLLDYIFDLELENTALVRMLSEEGGEEE